MALLPRLCEVLGGCKHCFSDHRTYRRAKEHALALLVCLGRRTISRSICVLGRQFRKGRFSKEDQNDEVLRFDFWKE